MKKYKHGLVTKKAQYRWLQETQPKDLCHHFMQCIPDQRWQQPGTRPRMHSPEAGNWQHPPLCRIPTANSTMKTRENRLSINAHIPTYNTFSSFRIRAYRIAVMWIIQSMWLKARETKPGPWWWRRARRTWLGAGMPRAAWWCLRHPC